MLQPLYMYGTIGWLTVLLCYTWQSSLNTTILPAIVVQTCSFKNHDALPHDHKHCHREQADQDHKHQDCGQEAYHQQVLERYSRWMPRIQQDEQCWRACQQVGALFNVIGGVHTVPVHLIHSNIGSHLTNAQASTATHHLNEAFANIGYYNPATGVDTAIQLCFASLDLAGNPFIGIASAVSLSETFDRNTQDAPLKNVIRWDSNRYINIWVVDHIISRMGGYATLSALHGKATDRVVMGGDLGRRTPARVAVLVHWGLFHIFQGGCAMQIIPLKATSFVPHCQTMPQRTPFITNKHAIYYG